MLILIDLDEPLADIERGFFENWRLRFPNEPYILQENRTTFYPEDEYPQHLREKVSGIYYEPGFYLNLPPVLGSIDALNEMLRLGHDVMICTSPLSRYEDCVLEKYLWVEKHLGKDFVKRIVMTSDKTIVRGDILIDDKPEIRGLAAPTWRHFLYDCPRNRYVTGKKRLTWENWRGVLGLE